MTIGNVSATITSTQLEQIIPTSDLKFHNCVLDTYNSNYNSSEDHATIEQIKTNLCDSLCCLVAFICHCPSIINYLSVLF